MQPGAGTPDDWNVVVTAFTHGRRPALRALRCLGRAGGTRHYNVLLATVDDPVRLLDTLEDEASRHPVLIDTISRVAPAAFAFNYASDADFEAQVRSAMQPRLERLAGKRFHVRVHARGARLSGTSREWEARLGAALLADAASAGAPAGIDFDDPDLILSIDAVEGRAGAGLWSREDMRTHRFLRPD